MTDERELHPPEEAEREENSGEYLWRVLKPAGCILVLLLMVTFLVFCFTYRGDPVADAPRAAETSETE